jgi:antitoxin CcdA
MRMRKAMSTVPSQSSHARRSNKQAINLSLSADVLKAAKHLHINISQVCDSHLREVVQKEQEARWRAEHAEFINAYNAAVEAEGLPLDEWRAF